MAAPVVFDGLAESHAQPLGQLHGLAELDLTAVPSSHLREQLRLGFPLELGERPEQLLETGRRDQLQDDKRLVAGVPEGVPLPAWLEHDVAGGGSDLVVTEHRPKGSAEDVGELVLVVVQMDRRCDCADVESLLDECEAVVGVGAADHEPVLAATEAGAFAVVRTDDPWAVRCLCHGIDAREHEGEGQFHKAGMSSRPWRAYVGSMARATTPARAVEKITRLSGSAPDLVSLWREASGVISEVVPYYAYPCWYTLDPASLLITSHFNEDVVEFPREWLANEYYGDDVNKLAEVARSGSGISTLHEATHGDPSSSQRWQENIKLGGDQELVARLQTRSGEVWGALGLYRETGNPMFAEADKAFVSAITPVLAAGARRALLLAEANEPDSPDSPGLVVLTDAWEVESSTPGVERWLSALPDGDWEKGQLPSAVVAVAGPRFELGELPRLRGGRGLPRACPQRDVGRPSRRDPGVQPAPTRGGHRGAGPAGSYRPTAYGGLRSDRP